MPPRFAPNVVPNTNGIKNNPDFIFEYPNTPCKYIAKCVVTNVNSPDINISDTVVEKSLSLKKLNGSIGDLALLSTNTKAKANKINILNSVIIIGDVTLYIPCPTNSTDIINATIAMVYVITPNMSIFCFVLSLVSL
ncbi:hypothetical protein D3C71_1473180 [compost metagenome]